MSASGAALVIREYLKLQKLRVLMGPGGVDMDADQDLYGERMD